MEGVDLVCAALSRLNRVLQFVIVISLRRRATDQASYLMSWE